MEEETLVSYLHAAYDQLISGKKITIYYLLFIKIKTLQFLLLNTLFFLFANYSQERS